MLLEEGGLQHLEDVMSHPQTHGDVLRLAESILDSLHRHRARTGYTGPPKTHTHRGTCPQKNQSQMGLKSVSLKKKNYSIFLFVFQRKTFHDKLRGLRKLLYVYVFTRAHPYDIEALLLFC